MERSEAITGWQVVVSSSIDERLYDCRIDIRARRPMQWCGTGISLQVGIGASIDQRLNHCWVIAKLGCHQERCIVNCRGD